MLTATDAVTSTDPLVVATPLTVTDPALPSVAFTPSDATPSVRVARFAEETQGTLQRVLWSLQASHPRAERRRAQRHPYPYPLRIWPADACRISAAGLLEPDGDGLVVMGKHISTGGLDFYTQNPVAERKIVASLQCDEGPAIRLLIELTWCRFGGHGMYVNGGRFIPALNHRRSTGQ